LARLREDDAIAEGAAHFGRENVAGARRANDQRHAEDLLIILARMTMRVQSRTSDDRAADAVRPVGLFGLDELGTATVGE
jgi:hypothetical protein